jgi:hypothetical protein
MTAVTSWWFALLPDVRLGEFPEQMVAAFRCDERQLANRRRAMPGGADELRVGIVGDAKAADEKIADVDAMNGTFIDAAVGSSHEKIAGGTFAFGAAKRHRAFGRPGSHLEGMDSIEKPV